MKIYRITVFCRKPQEKVFREGDISVDIRRDSQKTTKGKIYHRQNNPDRFDPYQGERVDEESEPKNKYLEELENAVEEEK